MLTRLKRTAFGLASTVPPLLVCAVLAAVAYWGHSTGWQAKKFSVLIGAEEAADEDDNSKPAEAPVTETAPGAPDWCEKHQVPDSLCTICHPDLPGASAVATPPP